MFIDHRQEQWPEWLGIAEFVYNNKVHSSTQTMPFKANYGQDPRIEFEGRKKGKYERAKRFVKENSGGSQSGARKGARRNKEVY